MSSSRRAPGRPRLIDLAEPTDLGILRAAAGLFLENGYRGVTMEMVAESAGLTKAAVYYHFHDKASLVVASMHWAFTYARAATEAILARPLPLEQRLETLAEAVLGLPQPFSSFSVLLQEAKPELTPDQIQSLRDAEAAVTRPLEQVISAATAAGEIEVEDPLLLVRSFVAALGAGQTREHHGGLLFPDRRRTARAIVSVMFRGIERR